MRKLTDWIKIYTFQNSLRLVGRWVVFSGAIDCGIHIARVGVLKRRL